MTNETLNTTDTTTLGLAPRPELSPSPTELQQLLPWEFRYFTDFSIEYSVITVGIAIICTLTGVFGNLLIIASILISKHLRSLGNLFVINLALTDLWVSGVTQPLSTIGSVGEHMFFYYNPELCDFIAACCLMSCVCSIVNISLIGLNRMIAVCYHTKYNKIFTRYTMIIWLAVPWILGMMGGLMHQNEGSLVREKAQYLGDMPNHSYIGVNQHWYDPKEGLCMYDRKFNHTYSRVVGSYALAWVTFAFCCYMRLFLFFYKKKKAMVGCAEEKGNKETISLAKTLFKIMIIFTVCWTPWALVTIIDENDEAPHWVYGLAIHLAHFNSSLNVFIYGGSNKAFLNGYKTVINKLACCEFVRVHVVPSRFTSTVAPASTHHTRRMTTHAPADATAAPTPNGDTHSTTAGTPQPKNGTTEGGEQKY